MKTEFKKWIPISLVSILLVSSVATYANSPGEDIVERFQNPGMEEGVKMGQHMKKGADPEMKEAVTQAFENNDYQAWVDAHSEFPGKLEFLTQENFEQMKEVHELVEAGNTEEAMELKKEFHSQIKEEMKEQKEAHKVAVDQAMENGDYNAWLEAVGGKGDIAEQVTLENFDEFSRVHELMQEGDKEGAKEIMEELGIERPKGQMNHGQMKKGFNKGGQGGVKIGQNRDK